MSRPAVLPARLFIRLPVALAALLAAPALAQPLPVTNAGFESPVLSAGGVGGVPPGWTALSGIVGHWHPTISTWNFQAAEGNQVLYLNVGATQQVTSTTIQAGQTYSLQVEWGNRPSFFSTVYNVELRAGSGSGAIVLASNSGEAPAPVGQYKTLTLIATVPAGSPAVGQPLTIFFSGNTQTTFDNVRLFRGLPPSACYANCDNSTAAPVLNALDFSCFLARFRNAEPYANCDGSTAAPVLNALDFSCFLTRFRAGCS